LSFFEAIVESVFKLLILAKVGLLTGNFLNFKKEFQKWGVGAKPPRLRGFASHPDSLFI
jgi:hypothetical protein